MTGEQHDDHCWLNIYGHAWRIAGFRGRDVIVAFRESEFGGSLIFGWLDISDVDWESYNAKAFELMEALRESGG